MHTNLPKNLTTVSRLYDQALIDDFAKKILPVHRPGNEHLFIPEHPFYEIHDTPSLLSSALTLFRWLGTKPGPIEIRFAKLTEPIYYEQKADKTLLLVSQDLAATPFIAAAALVHLVVHYQLQNKYHIRLEDPKNTELLVNELAIRAGFGIVILNGVAFDNRLQRRLKQLFYPSQDVTQIFPGEINLGQQLERYIKDHRIHNSSYMSSLAPWTHKLLPPALQPHAKQRKQQLIHITNVERSRKRRNLLLIGFVVSLIALYGCSRLYVSTKPLPVDANEVTLLKTIQDLKTQYEQCDLNVKQRRTAIDRNDLQAVRTVDAEQAKCVSIRNYYEYKRQQLLENN